MFMLSHAALSRLKPVGGLKIDISPSPERIVDTIINQIPTRNQTGTPDENLS